jgi:hypothetical protein
MQMYAGLTKLLDLWKDDADWQANAADCDKDGLTLSTESDDGATTAEFAEADMEAVDNVYVYDFAGSAHESERFYLRSEQVYKHKETGSYWLVWRDDIEAF